MSKKTSIEWLQIQLEVRGYTNEIVIDIETFYRLFEEAKEMHKQEIIDAYMAEIDCPEKELVSKILGGKYYRETFKETKIELLEEDIWCVHKYLDSINIPRNDGDGREYSIVNRIKMLQENYLEQMSNLETIYLSKDSQLPQQEISDEEILSRNIF